MITTELDKERKKEKLEESIIFFKKIKELYDFEELDIVRYESVGRFSIAVNKVQSEINKIHSGSIAPNRMDDLVLELDNLTKICIALILDEIKRCYDS